MNKSLTESKFPEKLKKTTVIPIYKKRDKPEAFYYCLYSIYHKGDVSDDA